MKNLEVLILFFLALSIDTVYGQSQETKGLEIAQQADEADQGFESVEANLKMKLTNTQGQVSERYMSNKILEVKDDGDKSMIVFESPKDVSGTKTLTYTHKQGPDDQWLYLPALRRVKRISSDNKSGPFMGSEFSYEDLSSSEVEKYTYKYVEETTMSGAKIAVVEQYPVDPKSGYSKRIAYYNLSVDHRMEKIEYYDRKGAKLKTLLYEDYKQYLDKHWRAGLLVMTNQQNGKKTELIFSDFAFKTGLSDASFTQNSLRR
ncbi:MAG: outer membrane lipoprotein-sorting protein [Bacteroidota bacterium]